MTSSRGEQRDEGGGGGLLSTLANSPAVKGLGDAAKDYAKARGGDLAKKVGEKVTGATDSLNGTAENGGFKATAVGEVAKRVTQGENPVKAALGGVGAGIKDKVSGALGRKKSGGSGNKKFMSIIEDINVGVPVDVAYDQWTQFQEFASFMKGVESVDQTDDVGSNWRVKVFKSRRNLKGTVTEQIPDRKIAWTTDGAKGTVKGLVTFHPLADDLTQILLVMEYYPQGLFEKTGNIWRAQGRRARLDLKNFRRFLMMRGEATGSWRGEIRDGEVVRTPEEVEQDEQREDEDQYEGEDEDQYEDEGEDESEGEDEEPEEDEEEEGEDEEPAARQAGNGRVDRAEDESDDEEEPEEERNFVHDEADQDEDEPEERPRPRQRSRRREPARAR
ncbi:SRPBCC family protein [Petropleomorpha daqingensis]|uniref:Putative membrane protein n=1 Tax=Petropleomorpha daqingensis TaxID=2026353 RepID=A0A853CCJ3_9ACTN|nr:SRPBCC family protein [Petropleomorpha daqingensis]NYJ05610.1 putative membrane protein [Petropleomorpha daqingensis]